MSVTTAQIVTKFKHRVFDYKKERKYTLVLETHDISQVNGDELKQRAYVDVVEVREDALSSKKNSQDEGAEFLIARYVIGGYKIYPIALHRLIRDSKGDASDTQEWVRLIKETKHEFFIITTHPIFGFHLVFEPSTQNLPVYCIERETKKKYEPGFKAVTILNAS